MLSLFTESLNNASFGIYLPRFTGTIYEVLSAPVSALEIVLAYVGAAATKSVILGLVILATATLFVPIHIMHPLWMIAFLVLTAATFCLFGFMIGIWAKGFDQLQFIPMLVITPLTFLGGAFYSIDMLPPAWRTVSLFNPIVYLISGFRWSFYETSDVGVGVSLAMTLAFFVALPGRSGVDFQDRVSVEAKARETPAGRPAETLESRDSAGPAPRKASTSTTRHCNLRRPFYCCAGRREMC